MVGRIWSVVVAVGLGVVACAGAQEPPPDSARHAPLDRILARYVRGERVDYLGIRSDAAIALRGYLDAMAEVDLAALPEKERLALYLNVYNATMIDAVVGRLRHDYSPSEKEFGVFDEPLVRLGGKTFSLNHLEHEILRKRFREPRIHVALVCGARSCPPLLPRAYRAADLDRVLDDNMRRFVRDGVRNRVDRRGRKLHLSQLFNWFAEDFGGADAVAAYVGGYAEGDVQGFSVDFLEYSWRLNIAPPAAGEWVVLLREVPSRAGGLAQGGIYAVARRDESWVDLELPGGGTERVAAEAVRPYRGDG